MYHRTEPARIVDDPVEQDALGPEWAETPAAFDTPEVPVVVDDIGGEEDTPAAAAADAPKPRRGK
jgi:hypothetical protein